MIVKTLELGPIMANCYIVVCEKTRKSAIIDPGDEAERILWELKDLRAEPLYIINTHGHFDHTGANKEIKEKTNAQILIHEKDEILLFHISEQAQFYGFTGENSPKADKYLQDGDIISFGEISFKVLHTPGHSEGGICLFYSNDKESVVFTGDTLFEGAVGRSDLYGGSHSKLTQSIKEKLYTLPENTKVYPGHGYPTTIKKEKKTNPFVRG